MTTPSPQRTRRRPRPCAADHAAWVLGATAAALLVAGVVDAALSGGAPGPVDGARHVAVFGLAAALLFVRAPGTGSGRRIWRTFALGVAISTAGEAVAIYVYDGEARGAASALFSAAYLTTCVALTFFLRRRVGDALRAFSLDALGFAVALAAIGSTVLLRPIVAHSSTTTVDATLTLLFTAFDVAIAAAVWSVASYTGRARGRQDQLLAGALAVMFVGDLLSVIGSTGWIPDPEGWARLIWEGSMLLLAAAAWQRPATAGALRVGGWWELVPTVAWAVAGLGSMIAAYALELPVACAVLAICALVLTGVRGSRMQLELRELIVVRAESLVDERTGLPNQRALFGELDLLLREDGRDGRRVALLIGHLEGFEELTDTLGHAAAGEVLGEVARRLSGVAHGTLARMEGDELATIVEDGEDPEAVAAQLDAALAAPVLTDGIAVDVRPVFGYARFPEDAGTPTDLARRADMARRDARARGLDVVAYDPARDHHSRDRLELAADLRSALQAPPASPDGLWLAFQPQVAIDTGEPVGVEALIRWRHPTRGEISPAELLPVAERSGLMSELTDWVLERAVVEAAALRRAGFHELRMSVNVSAVTLVDVGLPDRIAGALDRHAVPAEALVVEVTEDAVMRDHRRCREVLATIAALGVEISIDDFGTGQSSLAQLRHLPADELKIDRRFVSGMAADPLDAEIVHLVLALGHRMGLRVVAEGIETDVERELLTTLGCEVIQGFGVGRPMASAELRGWLAPAMRRSAA